MKSLKEIFRIGKGPSSSHTMGPAHAAEIFARRNPNAKAFEVTLYGSLAATGKGHLTDEAITEVLSEIAPVEIVWQAKTVLPYHTNGMRYKAFDAEKQVVDEWVVYSVGGGALSEGKGKDDMFYTTPVYQLSTMKEIQDWCEKNGRGNMGIPARSVDDNVPRSRRRLGKRRCSAWPTEPFAQGRQVLHKGAEL